MFLDCEVTLDAVVINGTAFRAGERLEKYEQLLGPPSRSWDGPQPAPYGHRNNILHYYDEAGLLLREHHATCLISSIDIVLEPARWYFPTRFAYAGRVMVCGVSVIAEMEFRDFARQCEIEFHPHLGHAWYVDGDRISIQIEVYFPARKRKADMGLISVIAVGFVGAHRLRDTSRA
ncbi:MAG TPA: hypothetical protein PKC45_18845 [Gemmatales bacterium]|nr:hypothetical protein [Gemmatales bacterium]